MDSKIVHLYMTDAEDGYAICLKGDSPAHWRAEKGSVQNLGPAWSVELQSDRPPVDAEIDWETVLERIIEAYDLSDPLITNFDWPCKQTA